jgi:hypothetical protein
MPSLPDPPLVHRSWLVRGLQSPNPQWAKTGHAILYETTLAFSRPMYWKDDTGGFKGGDASIYLTVAGHCELESGSSAVPGQIAVERRFYSIIIDLPADRDLVPRTTDTVAFTDQIGRPISLRVAKVDIAEGWADHLEIETEEWV